jgi:hypothetical protein
MKATAGDQCSTSAKKAAGEQAEDGAAAACCMLQQKNERQTSGVFVGKSKDKASLLPPPQTTTPPRLNPNHRRRCVPEFPPHVFFSFLSQDKTRGETKMNRSSFIFWLEIKMKFVHSKNKIVRKK